ncbi:MAG TPA: hypothetical protein VJN44_07985, partial [Roseateles sp.]|nr:hypothetical protein [Roseateles sp.]
MPKPPSQLPLLAADLAALRGLFGLLSDPLLLLDAGLCIVEANPAARQALALEGRSDRELPAGALRDWLRLAGEALLQGRRSPAAPTLSLVGGRRARPHLLALDGEADERTAVRWLLHIDCKADAG